MKWFKQLFSRRRVYDELSEEIRQHIEEKIEELVTSGMLRREAAAAARREFGNVTLTEETSREVWRWPSIENLGADVRYGLRTLGKSRGFTVVVILTLALGIGANTAIFSYVNAWLIKPLPYPRADRLMVLLSHNTKKGWTSKGVTSTADFLDYEEQNSSFEELACWTSWNFNLTSDGPPDRVDGGLVSWNFFQTLGVEPILGRTFSAGEARPGSSHVAILSRGLWQSRFAADPQVIGRTVKLQGETYTVVGVMPSDFQFPLMGVANIWAPLALDDKQRADRNGSWFHAFGRLKSGVSQQQAGAEIATMASRLEKLHPQTNTNLTSSLSPMTYEIGKNEGAEQVLIDFWIVGLVLLIACVNVANLMLARASGRAKEFAVRGALGASRARLIRQLLTESLLLFSAGGVAGALFAAWGNHWIAAAIPERIRGFLVNYGRVDLDVMTFAYTFGIALLCGVVFGLAPAFESTGLDFTRALKESGGRASGSPRAARLRRIFVAGEVALAVVVLISTALLVESLVRMVYGGVGFQPRNIMVAQLVIPPNKYSSESQVRTFYDQALTRIRALPEVMSAGASEYVPFGDSNQVEHIHVLGRPSAQPGGEPGAQYTAVTPSYFSTMQIPLLRGRLIELRDGPGAPNVAVVSEALAREQFPNEDPIGRQIEIPLQRKSWTIVGIVHDVKQFTLSDTPEAQLYVSAAQFPSGYMSIVARSSRPAPELGAAIRDAIWSVDSEQPVSRVRVLDDLITEQNTLMRLTTQVISFFGALALLLGAVGIYGVMAHSVGQRIHEMGIRMALGASPREMRRLVLGQGLKLTLVGIAFGVAAAAGVTRALSSMLYNVKASNPVTFTFVAVVFMLVALAACYIPARRAMQVDPMVALRYE
jgi:putative ABC transport system permease protein